VTFGLFNPLILKLRLHGSSSTKPKREQIEQLDVELEMKRELLTNYKKVERIVASRNTFFPFYLSSLFCQNFTIQLSQLTLRSDEPEYLCKWVGLPYSECRWEPASLISEDFQHQIDEFLERANSKYLPQASKKEKPKTFKKLTSQPSYIVGGKVRFPLATKTLFPEPLIIHYCS